MSVLRLMLCLSPVLVFASCDNCTFSRDPYCRDKEDIEDPKKPLPGQDADIDVCKMIPEANGTCSDLELAANAASVKTLIASGSFTGSSIDVRQLAGSTYDLVSIEYGRANRFSERAAEACDSILSSRTAAGELRATRRFTVLGSGAYLDEDIRLSDSTERRHVRIVTGTNILTPDTSCQTCVAAGTGGELDARLIETKFTGSATRDRLLSGGTDDTFVLIEAVAYLPPPLPDQDVSVVDCEAKMLYRKRGSASNGAGGADGAGGQNGTGGQGAGGAISGSGGLDATGGTVSTGGSGLGGENGTCVHQGTWAGEPFECAPGELACLPSGDTYVEFFEEEYACGASDYLLVCGETSSGGGYGGAADAPSCGCKCYIDGVLEDTCTFSASECGPSPVAGAGACKCSGFPGF